MVSRPRYSHFLRKIIHKIRRIIVGPNYNRVLDSSNVLAALDRIALLESQVNWRLLGLPARVENIKTEYLPLLADGRLADEALSQLRAFETLPSTLLEQVFSEPAGSLFAVSGWSDTENQIVAKSHVNIAVVDPTDVLGSGNNHLNGDLILKLPIIDAAARWTRPEFDRIWLSCGIERLTPLQLKVLFMQARVGLNKSGCLAGYFADYARCDAGLYWANPNRIRPITKGLIERLAISAGLKTPVFQDAPAAQGVAHSLFVIRLK